METLTCTVCNEDWQRERKRGVKPKTCPSCKENKAPKATTPRAPKARTSDSKAPEEESESPEVYQTGNFYSFMTHSGDTMATRNEVYARRRNAGISFCCAGTSHLGHLCKREQEQNGLTCTCDCHEEAAA